MFVSLQVIHFHECASCAKDCHGAQQVYDGNDPQLGVPHHDICYEEYNPDDHSDAAETEKKHFDVP